MRERREPSLHFIVSRNEMIEMVTACLKQGSDSELYMTAREVLERRYGSLGCDLSYPDDGSCYELTIHNPSEHGGLP